MDKKSVDKFKESILKDYPRLSKKDRFTFGCHPGVPCFNKCCNDVNIFLTPYDIIRLKNRLGITSGQFIERYTILPVEENLKHPVVMLQMNDKTLDCPFVGESGCTVYEDRPWSCRMFPVGVASPKEMKDKEETDEEFYFLLREDVCEGFAEEKEWTVEEWIRDQKAEDYNEMGEIFKEISLHDFFTKGKGIQPVKLEMFFMVCYDIDKFKSFVFDSTFLKRFEVDEKRVEKMKNDDVELLKFGFDWLRFALFGEKTLKLSDRYKQPA